MRIASSEAKQLIEEMMASIDPLGKYPMCYETAKSCAIKAVNKTIRDYEHNMEVFPEYRPIFIGGLTWWRSVHANLINL
jgi:hypothetical protein